MPYLFQSGIAINAEDSKVLVNGEDSFELSNQSQFDLLIYGNGMNEYRLAAYCVRSFNAPTDSQLIFKLVAPSQTAQSNPPVANQYVQFTPAVGLPTSQVQPLGAIPVYVTTVTGKVTTNTSGNGGSFYTSPQYWGG